MLKFSALYLYLLPFLHNALCSLHGRYTRDVRDYQLVIPRKITEDGKFLSFSLPHYFKHSSQNTRTKRSLDELVHYGILFGSKYRQLELWPNFKFLSPSAISEHRDRSVHVQKREIKDLDGSKICHYTGKVKGDSNSRVAISTCDGLSGHIFVDGRTYLLEPLLDHTPNKRGQHIHALYESEQNRLESPYSQCGTSDNWTKDWKSQLKKKYESGNITLGSKRGLNSVHRFLEVLVVCDKAFLNFHKGTDYHNYVLTIMNMVSDYFHDASIGNMIDLVVVRIIYLEKEEQELDLQVNGDAHRTLESFCNWQATINPKDIKNPSRHDIAILITRYDLCDLSTGISCSMLGIAYVGTPCTKDKSCSVNEDSGLKVGLTIAHELGHIMGCAHDTEKISGCKPFAEDGSYNVMSPIIDVNTRQWSTCSREFVTSLFDNDLGECLNNEPESSLFQFLGMLPGAVYDVDYQCNWILPGSRRCRVDLADFCTMLACGREGEGTCESDGNPPADGTKCGENKWCYRNKCVGSGQRPDAINGGWGDWGEWSSCSRSCGAGVSFQTRECNNPIPKHGGRYCIGERKKVKLCNTDHCPAGSPSFRQAQCSAKNKVLHDGQYYNWMAYFFESRPCDLLCVNDRNIFVKMAPRAKDGTRCRKGSRDMCIGGICTKVGCDYQINSDAVEDICGVCQGDGTSCKIVETTFLSKPGNGYTKVSIIPKGATNLVVEELLASPNTIAISDESGKYCLNGDMTEYIDDEYICGGTSGVYSHPEPNREKFVMHGPLKNSLVLYRNENVGYRYKYGEPTMNSKYQPKYHWEFLDWGDCSVRCGGGTEISLAACVEERAGKVSATLCHNIDRPPPRTRICNELPCSIKWRAGKWSHCTACRNRAGLRIRDVECVQESPIPGADDILVEDELCTGIKPGNRELCRSDRPCTKKREDIGISRDMMKALWYQTIVDLMNTNPWVLDGIISNSRTLRKMNRDLRRQIYNRQDESPKEACALFTGQLNNTKVTAKPPFQSGYIVEDDVPPEALKMMVIPIKAVAPSGNISDQAFESMGDQMSDTLDFQHQKNFTGPQAVEMIKNFNKPPSNDSCISTI
ncbi:adamts a disintegrin and metalloprotease with thrombospondin motifs protease [Holotrichia oblita]|uniref:Adamts a disintegrin and metalloprotease with thrombospondin motifs protease n=1 Tax=Holotrichia oblita TaxID=644536 RepID=A0ACB9SWX8_HOLOL|nr:adamts a disintegrin and metalloprotease with thrombospondin motifs protease [Holotrichia oblita]